MTMLSIFYFLPIAGKKRKVPFYLMYGHVIKPLQDMDRRDPLQRLHNHLRPILLLGYGL